MFYEIKKAMEAMHHPGIRSNLRRMIGNAVPYYVSASYPAHMPLTIYWSINSICNLRCKMCDVGMSNKEGTFYKNLRIDGIPHEIAIDRFKMVIDEVYLSKPFIVFNSTEPLLYKHLHEAISYCTSKGLQTAVTTNGYDLPNQAGALVRCGLTRLNVSIDGPPEIHNSIRGNKDSFQRSVDGILKYYEESRGGNLRNQIYINCTITNLNYRYLSKFIDAVGHLPVTGINFVYLWFIDDANAHEQNQLFGRQYPVTKSCLDDANQLTTVDIHELSRQIESIRTNDKVHILPELTRSQLNTYFHSPNKFIQKKSKCMASWFIVQILADGNIIPYSRCHNKSLGNINQCSFKNIWNGSKMKEWRSFIKRTKRMPMCKRCDLNY